MGKRVNELNLTKNSGLYSRYFGREEIITDGSTGDDPVYFCLK